MFSTAPVFEHVRRPGGRQSRERRLDQRFGLRARYEDRGRDDEIEVPERAVPGEIRDRLAVTAALREREESVDVRARQRIGRMRGEPCAIPLQRVREQHLGVDRHQAALREHAAHRPVVAGAQLVGLAVGGNNARERATTTHRGGAKR